MKRFAPIFILILSIFSANSQGPMLEYNNEDQYIIDTLKFLFFLDGKIVERKELMLRMSNGLKLRQVDGTIFTKEAIFRFGEKARYGIMVFETEKKNENNSNN